MHRILGSAALCGALFLALASAAEARRPTAQEISELQQLIDAAKYAQADVMVGTLTRDGVRSTALDVQAMRLEYFKGEFDAALEIAERILAGDRRQSDALNMRGLVKAERKDPAGAIADFDAAIASNPAYGKAHFNRAIQLCVQKRFDEADKAYDAARERLPDKAAVFDAQFVCHFAAGRVEQAIEVADAWFASGASYQMLARLSQAERAAGEHDKSYKTYLKAQAMHDSNNDFRSYMARIMLDIGAPQLALKRFDEQIAETPGNLRLYLDRGEAYDMLGRDDEALADYDRGIANGGQVSSLKRARPIALRGVIKLERGDIKGATADFDRAVAEDPNDPVGWYWRGELWMRSGNAGDAIWAYQSALKILPEDKTYLAALAKAEAAKK